jgi:WD40-like Beta Propeller Repeat
MGGLVFTYGTDIRPRLGLLHMDRIGRDKQPWEPLDRPYEMSSSSLSPDDDWIAYHSSHSGQLNVYIDRFPDLRDPKPISTKGGGGNPVWSADGREVFYRRLDGAMMSVSIDTTPMLRIGSPVRLFEWPESVGGGGRGWDVAPDGRFLMVKENPSTKTASDSIVVVQNWFEELKRRLTN